MTVQEIKNLIINSIAFYVDKMVFAECHEDYREYSGAQQALACLLFDIKKREEEEKCQNSTGPQNG